MKVIFLLKGLVGFLEFIAAVISDHNYNTELYWKCAKKDFRCCYHKKKATLKSNRYVNLFDNRNYFNMWNILKHYAAHQKYTHQK
jgi:hypothetical protein